MESSNGIYFYSRGVISMLSAPILLDLDNEIGFSSQTRLVEYDDPQRIWHDNFVEKQEQVQTQIDGFLNRRKRIAISKGSSIRPWKLSDYTNDNRLAKVANDILVTNDFARKVFNAGPDDLFDVSKIAADGKGIRKIKRTKTSITRGHPNLPLVSKTYEAYEIAIKMLPGGTDKYRTVLQEVRKSFQTSGAKPMVAGLNFSPAKEKEEVEFMPFPVEKVEQATFATEYRTRQFLKYDKRENEIKEIKDKLKKGLITVEEADDRIVEILDRKSIKGTGLQPIHVFTEDNATQIRTAEPRLNDRSFGYFLDQWRKFAPRRSYYSANYEEGFNEFIHYLLKINSLPDDGREYQIPTELVLMIPLNE